VRNPAEAPAVRSVFDVAQVRLFSVIIAEFNETVRSTDFISACHADPVLPTYLFRIIEVRCAALPCGRVDRAREEFA